MTNRKLWYTPATLQPDPDTSGRLAHIVPSPDCSGLKFIAAAMAMAQPRTVGGPRLAQRWPTLPTVGDSRISKWHEYN